MIKRRMKGFTLIELIAVLVILAILALIVTPLVMNIVKKAKDASNRRSVDAYGKSVELAVATYLLDNGDYPDSLDNLTVEYSGNEVTCLTKTLNSDGSIYLSGCSVKNTEVLDSNNSDGYYHYGRLTGGNNQTPNVGYREYQVGDQVTYNNINFYVIENSDSTSDSLKLLKATPLTVEEVNEYGGVGTENNHVNNGRTAVTLNGDGFGYMTYYQNNSCNSNIQNSCDNTYDNSDVKYVVDAWESSVFPDINISARLLTYEELLDNLGYELTEVCGSGGNCHDVPASTSSTHSFINIGVQYWTMSPYNDSIDFVRYIS